MFSVKGQWHREAEREKETGVLTVPCGALSSMELLHQVLLHLLTDNITGNEFQIYWLILLMRQVLISFQKLEPPCCQVKMALSHII